MAGVNSCMLAFHLCDEALMVRSSSLSGQEGTIYPQSCGHLDSSAFYVSSLAAISLPCDWAGAHVCTQITENVGQTDVLDAETAAVVAQAATGYLR